MGYTLDDRFVQVNFFKECGKWYTTEAIEWKDYEHSTKLIHDLFREYLDDPVKGRYTGMWAVCLEPYHIHSYPLMVKV